MKIKTSPRVLYKNNPLAEVVCQVRFSRLLALEKDPPSGLQDKFALIGFPLVTVDQAPSIQIAWQNIGTERVIPQNGPSFSPATVYHFSSVDGMKKISLNSEFIAFSCLKYEEWKYFDEEFYGILNVFLTVFPNASPIRAGLRYKDLISRENLGLHGVPWKQLISSFVGGVFHAEEYFENEILEEVSVTHQASHLGLSLEDCELLLQTALLKTADGSGLQAFLIDCDFFQESPRFNISFSNIRESLNTLHNSAGAIFRHCIEEKLHVALVPI